ASGFLSCTSNCSASSSWNVYSPLDTEPSAVCGAPDGTPYAIAKDLNSGGQDTTVWKFGTGWTQIGAIPNSGIAYACAVQGDALLVSATTNIGRFKLPAGPPA